MGQELPETTRWGYLGLVSSVTCCIELVLLTFGYGSVDQGLRLTDPNNKDSCFYGYGGDFGDEINDAQFCINVSILSKMAI